MSEQNRALIRASSDLDNEGITRQRVTLAPRAALRTVEWIAKTGHLTAPHREKRARRLELQGELAQMRAKQKSAALRAGVVQGDEVGLQAAAVADSMAGQAGQWHRARARGQRARVETVKECGESSLVIACECCGHKLERSQACGVGLLCVCCRGRIAARKRAQFRDAVACTLADPKVQMLLRRSSGASSRWSQKFVTLTAPHDPAHGEGKRIELLLAAWPHFVKVINAWMRGRPLFERGALEWYRATEWTGNDEGGHPHFHVWMLSPYLPLELVRGWWSYALERAGYASESVRRPVIDVREVSSRSVRGGLPNELIKYMTKDVLPNGSHVAPEVFAEVYKAFDGRRMTACSRGFLSQVKRRPSSCGECGAEGARRVKRIAGVRARVQASEHNRVQASEHGYSDAAGVVVWEASGRDWLDADGVQRDARGRAWSPVDDPIPF